MTFTITIPGLPTIVRNSRPYAFVQGFIEHLDGCGGRTHETSMDWNEAYDRGMNAADGWNALRTWWSERPWSNRSKTDA